MTNESASDSATGYSGPPSSGPRISAVIVSCNEADVIDACLQGVADWVDEIVVVDMQSTDGTREIVRRYTDRVVDHERLDYVEPARNFAISQATGDWIIMLDPDERVPQELARELQRIAVSGDADVVDIPRETWILGGPLIASGYQNDAHPRFFRRGVLTWPSEIHGAPDLRKTRTIQLPRDPGMSVKHDTWRTVASQLDRIQRYAPQEVALLQKQGCIFNVDRMLRAMWIAFRRSFITGQGYRDGVRGLFVGLLLADYQMVIHMELWEHQKKPLNGNSTVERWSRRLSPLYNLARTLRRRLPAPNVSGRSPRTRRD